MGGLEAEQARAAKVQDALYRIAELAGAAQDLQAFYRAIHEVVGELMHAENFFIALYDEERRLISWPYFVDELEDERPDPNHWVEFGQGYATGSTAYVLRTGEVQMIPHERYLALVAQGEIEAHGADTEESTWLGVPLKAEGRTVGVLAVQSYTEDVQYTDQDRDLLAFVAQHVGGALSRARAIEETRVRNAELTLINSVQAAIAGELDMQSLYDAVGDRIQEIFDSQSVSIRTLDEASGLLLYPYLIERGRRIQTEPRAPAGFAKHVLATRESLMINENILAEVERYGSSIVAGEEPKSVLFVPLVAGGKATGAISLQNFDREHAFGESDQRLLETLAGSLSVALENARLVHETRQRNAELALINSVQEAIAGELEMQPIYDAVGDRIREIFDAQIVAIRTLDATGFMHSPYLIERGRRLQPEPRIPIGFSKHVLETREPLVVNEHVREESARYGSAVTDGEMVKSLLFVPLITGGKATGLISLQNIDREHAFSASDQQLLETLAGSLSVALENARLVHETRQRNAELALINSVQEALAGELDMQSIYDVVGDKIQEIFDAQVVDIGLYDVPAGLIRYPYVIERGVRFPDEPGQIEDAPMSQEVIKSKAPQLVADVDAWLAERGETQLPIQGEPARSMLIAPLMSGDELRGAISLQNLDRTNAFSDSDQRLLTTLASSLSVALENARLVHETRQRNAELALINSVQDALAGELEMQAIYDVVGDKIQEIFDAQVVDIGMYDFPAGLIRYPYVIERGVRYPDEPVPIEGSTMIRHIIETKAPLIVGDVDAWLAERGESQSIAQGEAARSLLAAPLMSGDEIRGRIGLQNLDRTDAFSESDLRLLTTLASSLSVALENARLVHETRQRNAELALINGVQEALAGELDEQAIYDAVGDKIQEVFDTQTVLISRLDEATGQLVVPYSVERGVRQQWEPAPVRGFSKYVFDTRRPLMINEDLDGESERRGIERGQTVGEEPKSLLFVPLITGGKATGAISLQNVDREHAFSESDQQLLTTLARSLSVALDNARLVHETRQRVGELATVNSVGQALSSQLDLGALIELVGERVRETFEADLAYVALHDRSSDRIDFAYYYEDRQQKDEPSIAYGEGLTTRILESREPLLLNRSPQFEEHEATRVGTRVRSFLGVPILTGERAIGVISVQSVEEEGRFGEADVRLLATIAANVGVAIQNARLFAEVERQRGYLESLVSITPAAVVVLDADERVTDWNPAAAELFGYSAGEAVGRPLDELIFGEAGREEGREITEEAMREGRAQRIARRRSRDGTALDVELMLVPLTVDGAHAGFLGVYHDVTELQRARQEAEAATQAKSAFLATMSHEIRTPMNAVIGMTDLLLGTELTGEQREFAEVVHSSGDALLHVIDDILDYSKIEAGKLDLEHEPFNLRVCVEGALDIVAPRAWEKGIELGCLIDEGAPAGVVGDEARLRQVLLNLLSNGVKFTEAGEVIVLVGAEGTGDGSYRLEIGVRDTGIGIPRDRMGELFTSFSQVDASTTRRFGGTGLGLAISKRLVELMGGTISVESEQGTGSTFRISLPVAAADVPSPISLEEGLPQLADKRVLIVDDNATNREIVTRHARSWGMEPVAVELPSEALALVDAGQPFDVAVLDMMMPELDGLALAHELRSRRSAAELPLLLLTSLGRLPQAETGNVFSAQLSKPLKASQLYNTLLKLLTTGDTSDEGVEPAGDGKHTKSALRILLAEDNAMNQKVALRLLERLGYRADVVWNGLEAIAALERQPYDVVLMDVQMPELDGLDATRRICEEWPPEARPHIVAMTANALPEDREACFAAGMNDYVAKPIRTEELAAALKRVKPLRNDGDHVSLDDGALRNLRDLGGEEFLGEVIDAFLADAPELIATLGRSLADGAAEELRRAAHTLKSNGATLGADDFAELCRDLEHRARSGELGGASELVERIEAAYASLRDALTVLRSEPVA